MQRWASVIQSQEGSRLITEW